MCIICVFEECLYVEFVMGEIFGFVYFYVGEEVFVVGVMVYLCDDDCIVFIYCGYGYCIVKGVDVYGMMVEIYGKKIGVCQGKGGFMYIVDLEKGMFGVNGIVGVGVLLVVGFVLVVKLKGSDVVVVVFFGDGGFNEGVVFEVMNLVVVWNLLCLFVVENNGYVEVIVVNWLVVCDYIVDCVVGFGMFGVIVDGFDFFVVYEVVGVVIECVCVGEGLLLIEVKLICYYGYFEGDVQIYCDFDEVKYYWEICDCFKQFCECICYVGLFFVSDLDVIDVEVEVCIEDVVQCVKNDFKLELDDLLCDVYVFYF